LLDRLAQAGADLTPVSPAVFARMAYGDRNEGFIAVASPAMRSLADLQLPKAAVVAVLEQVEKPGNVGAVLRSADAAGVSAVIATHPQTDFHNPNAIRASLGAVFTTPVVAAPAQETFDWLTRLGLPIFAARVEGAVEHHRADLSRGGAIVLGAESRGLSDFWRRDEVTAVRIPMLGVVDSLNVSTAAAVMFFEALRQRQSD
jgi:RNA methyltransferase, TrmH family